MKVIMNIVLTRFSSFYESQLFPIKFGFRSSKGCNNGITYHPQNMHTCHQTIPIVNLSNRRIYTCYVDFTAAYDHIVLLLHYTIFTESFIQGIQYGYISNVSKNNKGEMRVPVYSFSRLWIVHIQ